MRELLDGAVGELMELGDYLSDFDRRFWNLDATGFWKLERRQHFREPGYDTWEAFTRGDWDESMRLLDAHRAAIAAEHQRMDELGITVNWVRVVEEPVTPYLQWELQVHRIREECGSVIRVLSDDQVAALETAGPLPEINVMGAGAVYEITYDDGAVDGARRYTDPDLVARCRQLIADLHAAGEPLSDYFAREVDGLKPPTGEFSR